VDAVCREADGAVAWEVHQSNLITDLCRRRFFLYPLVGGASGVYCVTSPTVEAPLIGRVSLPDDGNASSSQASAQLTPTYDSLTLTKTWSATFAAPAANRAIGTIGLAAGGRNVNFGPSLLVAYTLLSPSKVQTTTQTLEVLYRITLTPSY
jgi:hypothetical protein